MIGLRAIFYSILVVFLVIFRLEAVKEAPFSF
jgi:hypothetical protein